MDKIANADLKDYCMNKNTKIALLRRYIPEFKEKDIEDDIDKFTSSFKMSETANDLLFAILCFIEGLYEEQSIESVIDFLDSLIFSITYDDNKFENQLLEMMILGQCCSTAIFIYAEFKLLDKETQLDLIYECKQTIQESDYKKVLKSYFS